MKLRFKKTKYLLRITVSLLLSFTLPLVLFGCTKSKHTYSGFVMDTTYSLSIYSEEKKALLCETEIKNEAEKADEMLSAFDTESTLYKINARNEVSADSVKEIINILNTCEQVSVLCDQRYSVVCGAVTRLWGIGSGVEYIPTSDEAAQKAALCGSDKISVEDGNIEFLSDGVLLDLGSVGKGYACDKAKEIFEKTEIKSAVAVFGGSVLTYGNKNGNGWKIDIRSPFDETTAGVLSIEDTSFISTSGGYERFFEKDGEIYHHIFDLKTGMPSSSSLASVTVICENGVLSDALSTACFIIGLEESKKLLENFENVSAVFISDDGSIYTYRAKDIFSANTPFVLKGEV